MRGERDEQDYMNISKTGIIYQNDSSMTKEVDFIALLDLCMLATYQLGFQLEPFHTMNSLYHFAIRFLKSINAYYIPNGCM